jgi:hypothetical protein
MIQSVMDQSCINHHHSFFFKSITISVGMDLHSVILNFFNIPTIYFPWIRKNLTSPFSYFLSQEVVHHTQILYLEIKSQSLLVSNNTAS